MKFRVQYQGIEFEVEPVYDEGRDTFIFDQPPIYHGGDIMNDVLSWEAMEDIAITAMEEAEISGYNAEE